MSQPYPVLGFRNVTNTLHTNVNCGMHRNARYANTPVIVTSVYAIEHRCKRCGDGFKSPSTESINTAWAQAERIRNKRTDPSWPAYCRKQAALMVTEWDASITADCGCMTEQDGYGNEVVAEHSSDCDLYMDGEL